MNRPFDAARYAGLLEGLEATELKLSHVLESNPVFRFDADYFNKTSLTVINRLSAIGATPLGDIAKVTDGIHESIPFIEDGPIKILSAKHPKDNFIDTTSYETISQAYHDKNPRTQLRTGDVLLSTVGTIGNAAVVTEDILPANSDRHIGIIRPRSRSISPYFLSTFLTGRHGRAQSMRETTGNVQLNLFISKIDRLLVPRFSKSFEARIVATVEAAYAARQYVEFSILDAEQELLAMLGLADWNPPQPQSYVRNSRDAFTAGRLDAEYFSPATRAIIDILGQRGDCALGDLCQVSTGYTWKSDQFIERGGSDDGAPFVRIRDCKPGGIWTDGLDRLEAGYAAAQDQPHAKAGHLVVGMDGLKWFYASLLMGGAYINQRVAWLVPTDESFPVEYLLTVLNSLIGQRQLLSRMTIAQTVGHITLVDLRELRIPILDRNTRRAIADQAHGAITNRQRATSLLDAAKRAVEIAIEESEAAALAYLQAAQVDTP